MDVESIEKKYPLHWLVWNNSYEELQEKLKNEAVNTQSHTVFIIKFIFVLIGSDNIFSGNLSFICKRNWSISAGLKI